MKKTDPRAMGTSAESGVIVANEGNGHVTPKDGTVSPDLSVILGALQTMR
jgi:hypothetical protein